MEIKINSKKFGKQIILIDDEDYEKIKDKSLSLFKNSRSGEEVLYVRTSWINGKRFLLHRFLTDCPDRMVVDHINRNTLDNRKENLRICSSFENCKNTNGKKSVNKKSKYKGVFIYKKNIWLAKIGNNNKVINIGQFETEKDAAIAYNEACIKYHGEYGALNDID